MFAITDCNHAMLFFEILNRPKATTGVCDVPRNPRHYGREKLAHVNRLSQAMCPMVATSPRILQRRCEALLGKTPLSYFQDPRVERAQSRQRPRRHRRRGRLRRRRNVANAVARTSGTRRARAQREPALMTDELQFIHVKLARRWAQPTSARPDCVPVVAYTSLHQTPK